MLDDVLVYDNLLQFGFSDTVRALVTLYGYHAYHARAYVRAMRDNGGEIMEHQITVNDIGAIEHCDCYEWVELVIEGSYMDLVGKVYAAAEAADRFVSSGQVDVDGILTFHLFKNIHHEDPPAWALGQDPYRCEDCGSLIDEDLECPVCDREPHIEDHVHFEVKHNDRRRVFIICAKPHVLNWKTMPWDVHAAILQAEQDWKDKGYRYADFGEEV